MEPRWSPNGQQIAFMSDRGGSQDIWIVDVAGGSARQLTNWPGFEGPARWAHDGSAVYFLSDKDSKLQDIWRVTPAGGEPVRVTTAGNMNAFETFAGAPGLLAMTISTQGGQLSLTRIGADGRSTNVWNHGSALLAATASRGDAVIAGVEQTDGRLRSMLLKTDGSGGRVILEPGQSAQNLSNDGEWVLYAIASGGRNDLGLLRLADGVTRRLTTTPENEVGAEFTSDGKRVLFRRTDSVQRIMKVDLTRLINK
jgi:Tol biopolymer transport system component